MSAALLLATTALAGLSIQSLYREAQVRKRLITDTLRTIADVASARLDAAMAETDRGIGGELERTPVRADDLLKNVAAIEASAPWRQPLVLVSTSLERRDVESFPAAEAAEYREHNYAGAAALYTREASQASNARRRAAALNGKARAEFKSGDAQRALATYLQLIVETDAFDSEAARLWLIARVQSVDLLRLLGREADLRHSVIDIYRFILTRRFILDPEVYEFYRSALRSQTAQVAPDALAPIRAREKELDSIEPLVRGMDSAVTFVPLGGGLSVAHVWTLSGARALLDHSLRDPGPWSGVRIRLVDDGTTNGIPATASLAHRPHWRVEAVPEAGSVDALASREVLRFGALLVLVFTTVVAALFLAARSVARELAVSQMRSDFVASVSHELKTPLSLIRMFSESLREGWVSEDKRAGYYEVITRESERLTGLINNVLDFSRIESGTRKYNRATVDMSKRLADLLERYRYHLDAAEIRLVRELPMDAVYAVVDPEAIEQVLVNLLSNAVKYMRPAGDEPRQVRVSLEATPDHAIVRIADTGIGISEEDRLHIFERFWRAGDDRVRAVAGSGLGLTLVKHIVEAHDGAITVESIPGGGSTFSVMLPAASGELP